MATSPSPTMRTAAGPLVVYHGLLLGGAFLIIRGNVLGSVLTLFAGAVLVIGGIAVEIGILYWAADLIRKGARLSASATTAGGEGSRSYSAGRWLCTVCGWKGDGARRICPRCGRLMIRFSAPARVPPPA